MERHAGYKLLSTHFEEGNGCMLGRACPSNHATNRQMIVMIAVPGVDMNSKPNRSWTNHTTHGEKLVCWGFKAQSQET